MGMGRVRLQPGDRHVHARHYGRHTAAGERRQVRVRVPHESEGERLRVHGVRETMNQSRKPDALNPDHWAMNGYAFSIETSRVFMSRLPMMSSTSDTRHRSLIER